MINLGAMNPKTMAVLVGGGLVALWYIKNSAFEAVGHVKDTVVEGTGEALQAVNPVDDENIFYQGANSVVSTLSGGQYQDVGDVFFQLFHGEE